MKVSIPINVPQEVVDAIVAKAKELGHSIEPRHQKLLVIDTMTEVVKNNLLVYTHQGIKESFDAWMEENEDSFEDILREKNYHI